MFNTRKEANMQIYPVIHYKDDETTIEEAEIAYNAGADGVFLISHLGSNELLIQLAVEIKKQFGFKVGLNFLGDDAIYTAKIVKQNNLDMVWSDYCGVSSLGLCFEGLTLQAWAKENKHIDVFASVAFKYQAEEPNPSLAAQLAQAAGFIPTTSGSGTGQAPTVEKIANMYEATGGLLAVASGMTPENIAQFKPYLSHVLVSTGISKDEYHFDESKIKLFINVLK
jgi:predicted TIM-barrel enzyme